MKNSTGFRVLGLMAGMFFITNIALCQQEVSNEISYKVDFGPVYPIEGTSSSITGKAALNDKTGAFEQLSFDVDVNTFIGINSGYLGWISNSWRNPDMKFTSTSIAKKGNDLMVDGRLEFRRRTSFVQVRMTQKTIGTTIILSGDFTLNTSDFFIIAPHRDLVPTWIPFKVTLVFDSVKLKE